MMHPFRTMDDVVVPKDKAFGYVYGYSSDEDMYLVQCFNGKDSGWYHPEEMRHLTLETAVQLVLSWSDAA